MTENYNKQIRANSLKPLIILILILSQMYLWAQGNTCPIRVDIEPNIEQLTLPLVIQSTCSGKQVNQGVTIADDQAYFEASLDSFESNCLKFSDFNINLKPGAQILGLALRIDGFQSPSKSISISDVNFHIGTETNIGINKAGKNVYGIELSDFENTWQYGHGTDTWGIELTRDLLNDENFGLTIAFSNLEIAPSSISIDKVELIVYYLDLYTICDHSCSVFYVDQAQGEEYHWTMPTDVKLASESLASGIINLDFSQASPGIHTICVNRSDNGNQDNETCCRDILVDVCGVSSVSGLIWNDINSNGIRDSIETVINGKQLYIYDSQNYPRDTFITKADGTYQFTILESGYYYLSLDSNEEFGTGPYQVGNPHFDNDAFSVGSSIRTDFIYLEAHDSISNFDFGLVQKGTEISGQVYDDLNGDLDSTNDIDLGNILIKLYTSSDLLVDSIRSDNLGFFEFSKVQDGSYLIEVCLADNYVFSANYNVADLHNIEIEAGEPITDLAIYLVQYSTIGDYTWEDINENGIQDQGEPGLAGVDIELLDDSGNLIQSTTSNQEGNYLFEGIFPGDYFVRFAELENLEYSINFSDSEFNSDIVTNDGKTSIINVVSGSTNLSIDGGFVRSTGTILGFVWNDENVDGLQSQGEQGIAGIQINLINEQGAILRFLWTNELGQYEFDRIPFGNYVIVIADFQGYQLTFENLENEDLNSDIGSNGESQAISLTSGNRLEVVDAGLFDCFAEIGDFIWLDENENGLQESNEPGISGVIVRLLKDELIIQQTESNNDGFYSFREVNAGAYLIEFEFLASFSITSSESNDELNSDATEEQTSAELKTARTEIFSIDQCTVLNTIDLGLVANTVENVIGDFVWHDHIQNGLQDEGEEGINGISIKLYNDSGQIIDSTISTNHPNETFAGYYEFKGTFEGTYYIIFEIPSNAEFATSIGGNEERNSDVTGILDIGATDLFSINLGESLQDIDCGLIFPLSSIGDYVWNDNNANGLQDLDEIGINNIKIYLFESDGNIVDSTISTNNPNNGMPGYYLFLEIANGEYFLSFELPDQFEYSPVITEDQSLNSDVTNGNGFGTTGLITINGSEQKLDVDCGMYLVSTIIGDYVWFDENANGLQDIEEGGFANIKVTLFTEDNELVSEVFSNVFGFYSFANVSSGAYYLNFESKIGYNYTTDFNAGSEINSVADEFGNSPIFLVTDGNPITDLDCGYISRTLVGDFIWNDVNKDGIQNNEEGIANVKISIFDIDDILIDSTISDEFGKYFFYGLAGGEYYLQVEIPLNFQVTIPNAINDLIDNDALSNGITENFILGSNEKIDRLDIGLFETTGLSSGWIFHDENANQIKEDEEYGVANIKVEVLDDQSNIVYTVFSDSQGKYDIGALVAGNYRLKCTVPNNYFISDVLGSNIVFNKTPVSSAFSSKGTSMINMDFGIFTYGSIDFVAWNDNNGNGLEDNGEDDFKGIKAFLFDTVGNYVSDLYVSEKEYSKVVPGNYVIRIPKSNNFYLTDTQGDEMVSSFDNDFVESEEFYESVSFEVGSTQHIEDIKAGFYYPGSIGKMVWLDENLNGIQDPHEVGVVDLKVELYNEQSKVIDSIRTDSNGYYHFGNLRKGNYYVKFDISDSYEFTYIETLTDQSQSTVVNKYGYGTTAMISLLPAMRLKNIDAGVILNDVLFSDLLDFKGRRSGSENVLYWTTNTTRVISKYILQRRKDGEREFMEIGEITAIDQEKDRQEYQYLDKNAQEAGNYYYRLKEYDLHENFTYSDVAVVKVLYDVFTFNVSPNPADDVLNVQFEVAEKSKLTITLLDEAGKRIQSIVNYDEFETGIYQLPIHVSHYPNGFYILQMTAGHRVYHEKLIIFRN